MNNKLSKFSKSACGKSYKDLILKGLISHDSEQLSILTKLDKLSNVISAKRSLKKENSNRWLPLKFQKKVTSSSLAGIYLYGGVGTGKSMLMDIFFKQVRTEQKSRTHFHKFMQEIHENINTARENDAIDPIDEIALTIIKKVSVLCFDEFQINDITDAMIVGRLFSKLIDGGVFIVITSNRPPDDLYKDGLNRQLFLPFIKLLKKRLDIVRLEVTKDYRREKIVGRPTYFSPITHNSKQEFEEIWTSLVPEPCGPLELKIKGRIFSLSYYHNSVGRSTFSNLCGVAVGALDYLMLCEHLKVLFIEDIPVLSSLEADSAKRFVTLIDTLYESHTKLICIADEPPEKLYTTGAGSFEFNRTVSRLYEMQSERWIKAIRI